MFERLLIVGLGSIGRRHARIARSLFPNASITALRHTRSEDTPAEVDACVYSLDEAFRFDPQVAVIASPSTKHLDTAVPLAKRGVHLLVEKPIASSATGVRQLIEAADDSGITLLVGYNLRFAPSLQRFRELLLAGRIGKPLVVRAEVGQYLPGWRPDTDYRNAVSARASLGGGVLLELSHEIDYLRWIFGDVAWVSATLDRVSDLEIDVEDTAHLALAFSAGRPMRASLNMDFVRRDSTRSCTVIGDAGTLRWNGLEGAVDIFAENATTWTRSFAHVSARDETYVEEWKHFAACVAGDEKSLITGFDGLAVMNVIDAARRSNDAHGIIAVDPIERSVQRSIVP
jgi:predicted dehydrogenase